jgi:hypothetical protein
MVIRRNVRKDTITNFNQVDLLFDSYTVEEAITPTDNIHDSRCSWGERLSALLMCKFTGISASQLQFIVIAWCGSATDFWLSQTSVTVNSVPLWKLFYNINMLS